MKYIYKRLGKGVFALFTSTIPLFRIKSACCSQLQFFIPTSGNHTQRMMKPLSASGTNTFLEVLA